MQGYTNKEGGGGGDSKNKNPSMRVGYWTPTKGVKSGNIISRLKNELISCFISLPFARPCYMCTAKRCLAEATVFLPKRKAS